MKLKILFLLIFLTGTFIVRGSPQNQLITGTVTDAETGEFLPGVNVLVEGTQVGASTDLYGKFSIVKPAEGAIIVFSFVGYTTERITYSGQTVLNAKLYQEIHALDDVVVIGYGTIKKSDLTGAIASVNSKEFAKTTPVNVSSALQGRVAGLMSTSTSGTPGSEDIIRIRGLGTLNNKDPIYVVDGTIIDNTDPLDPASNIRFLNPLDIESIDVLKDASAQAIYGSRGANGVILITTRKGSEGLPEVSFSSTIGFGSITKVPEVLKPVEFRDFIMTSHYNGYMRSVTNPNPDVLPDTLNNTTKQVAAEYDRGVYTDWLDEVLKENVLNQNYYLSINGGTKYAHYAASAGYLNNDGIISNYNYKRYAFRLNTDYVLGKYIKVGENLGISSEMKSGLDNIANPFYIAMDSDPLAPVLKPVGSVDPTDPDYKYNKYDASGITNYNPVLQTELIDRERSVLTLVGNIFAEATILEDFKFRSSYGFNVAYSDISDYTPRYNVSATLQNPASKLTGYNYRTTGWVWENTLNYTKRVKNHYLNALLGFTSEYLHASIQNPAKQNTPNNEPEMQTFSAATTQPTVTGSYNENTMLSYLGRINYSFGDRYLLTATIRRDGSSKFGTGYRWGTFPSFSAGWNIGNEKFFQSRGTEFIRNLKLRAGWGQIGNTSLPSYYAYVSQVSSGLTDGWVDNRYSFGETVYTGYYLSTIGTPDISWETTEQINFGIEIGFLKNSLNFTADYFIKNTNDMLLRVSSPTYPGYPLSANPYTNAGSVQNSGFEILADYSGKSGDFYYGITLNAATFRNKVTSLGSGDRPMYNVASRTEVGYPMACFYGWVTDGLFQTEEEVQEHKGPGGTVLQPNAHAGDFRFKNIYDDDAINAYDQTWIGNPWPKLTYGINISLGYKNIDLLIFAQGSYGNDIFVSVSPNLGSGNILKYIYEEAWSGPGSSDNQPILSSVNNNNNYRISDYFVHDGSYLRFKNLQIGYSLPKPSLDKLKISGCRFWAGGINLLTLTSYPFVDPEVGVLSTSKVGVGGDPINLYPQSREYQIGVTVTF